MFGCLTNDGHHSYVVLNVSAKSQWFSKWLLRVLSLINNNTESQFIKLLWTVDSRVGGGA